MPDSMRVHRVWHFAMGTLTLVSALCVTGQVVPRQESEASQDSKSNPVIRATTRVVNVSLVATDAQGNPVKDLAKREVTILDGGKPQVISFFSAVDDTQLLPAGPALGPDTYTNLPVGKAEPPSVTILLFDVLNSKWTSQGFGLHHVRKFLRQIEPQDHIGLYLLSDDLKVLHDFRDDAFDLVQAISRYDEQHGVHRREQDSAEKDDGRYGPALDRFLSGKDNRYRFALDNPARSAPDFTGVPGPGSTGYVRDKLELACNMTIASLQQIATQLSGAPGRKSLIWVADAVVSPLLAEEWKQPHLLGDDRNSLPCENSDEIERLVRLMNGAGVAVYPVSAEGLETEELGFKNTGSPVSSVAKDPPGSSGSAGKPHATSGKASSPSPVPDLESRLPDASQHMAMEELASRTGGRAYFNRNDLETSIRRALDDARFTYSIAYYPDHDRWKGEWRRIEVRVDRPGVKALARNGYFALPDVRPLAPNGRYEFLSELAASSLDSPKVPMTVHIAVSSGANGRRLYAQVRLDPVSMLTLQDDGRWKGSFEVVFMQIGKSNKLLDLTAESMDAELSAREYADASQEGYQLPADLKFMPGVVKLCVILRDKLSDAAGSVHIPLERYAAPLGPH